MTGGVTAQDAAEIDAVLTAAARTLSRDDPRTEAQRRADVFADLLLGRLGFTDPDADPEAEGDPDDPAEAPNTGEWTEVEDIDPATGKVTVTHQVRTDSDGEVMESREIEPPGGWRFPAMVRRARRIRIGVVVPLSSLLGCSDTPGQVADRSGFVPGEVLRNLIATALGPDGAAPDRRNRDEVVFTRLLTDDGGRLLDTTELGRFASARLAEAIRIRAGTCRFPTCSVPADRCDIDHHEPQPRGPTSGRNGDPDCRRHHRGKTHAWLATVREDDAVYWTMPDAGRYGCVDDPLLTAGSRGLCSA